MELEKELQSGSMDELCDAILKLRTRQECKKFLRDLCTFSELRAFVERFQVVKMVDDKFSYREISEKTGASTATITRVAHWLHHGMGGYQLVLQRQK